MPDDIDFDGGRRRSSQGNALVTVLLLLLCGALGAGAYFLWTKERAASQGLAAREEEVRKLESEGKARGERLAGLESERQKLAASASEADNLRAALAAAESRLHETEVARAEVDARLSEFKEVMAKFRTMIDSGTLQVTFRKGRMIVELPAGVLFDSGSADLSTDGQKAVASVAAILRSVPNRRFIVAGNTDSVPAVKEFKSNWSLSAARAVTVTEALIRAGMDPRRLMAAGVAEFDPIASNATETGKQKNRRIDIVLEPYLAGLPEDDAGAAKGTAAKGAAPGAR